MKKFFVCLVVYAVLCLAILVQAWARSYHPSTPMVPSVQPDAQSLQCVAAVVYHEARGLPTDAAKIHVGLVALNRVGRFGYPSSVCAVVHQKTYVKSARKTLCQFTWFCSARLRQVQEKQAYQSSLAIARVVYQQYQKHGPTDEISFTSARSFNHHAFSAVARYSAFTFLKPKHTTKIALR